MVEPGRRVEAWTYNGTVPGPTMKVDPGDNVRVVLTNELPESTVAHFHGVELPNAMDGVPDITQAPVKPGQSYSYEFTAQQSPAAMYHSHHNAAKQVSNGLAGAFLIGSEPVPAGVTVAQEHVMMLNDAGTIGFSLNGKSFPAGSGRALHGAGAGDGTGHVGVALPHPPPMPSARTACSAWSPLWWSDDLLHG